MLPLHFVSRKTGHPIVEEFREKDVKKRTAIFSDMKSTDKKILVTENEEQFYISKDKLEATHQLIHHLVYQCDYCGEEMVELTDYENIKCPHCRNTLTVEEDLLWD